MMKMKKMFPKILSSALSITLLSVLSFFIISSTNIQQARAAQSAQVIVPQANVYQYPQASSNIISHLSQGQTVAVSNLPTAGFYKVRLANGDLGWVSGNDVLSGGGSSASGAPKGKSQYSAPRARRRRNDDNADMQPSSNVDSFRFLFGYGIQSLSYSGLADTFGTDNAKGLNLGKNFDFELQFKINPKLFWAIKIESLSSDTGSVALNSELSQEITVKQVPIEVGLVWSPISTHRFRLGFGAYLGALVSSNANVQFSDSVSGEQKTIDYSTTELCGEISSQASFGLGDTFGIFVEAAYRYDQSGTTPAATDITGTVAIPGFKINYSGVMARIGLELRL
jgi:hypothetical protein